MRIYYSFVEFHSPVFSQGKNLGTKIHAERDKAVLFYDSEIPNANMNMIYKGKQTSFGDYHSADIIQEKKEEKEAPKRGRPPAQE